MRIDQLYEKLSRLEFIENFHVTNKAHKITGKTNRVLKIYGEEAKIAEVYLDEIFMVRTTNDGFQQLSFMERQIIFHLLTNFSKTQVPARRSEMYFVYYNDLNNIPHFIKRLGNGRLTDDIIPFAYFNTLNLEQKQRYLFNMMELEEFPQDYRPTFTQQSFVKAMAYDDFIEAMEKRYPDDIDNDSSPE